MSLECLFFSHLYTDKLLELLREDLQIPDRRTVVFCNTTQSCDFLGHFLTVNEIPHIKLHSSIAIQVGEFESRSE